jgi:hypothetical protein
MLYKTIILELLQDQYPTLHEQLRQERRLLPALDQYAMELKASHEACKDQIAQAKPGSDPSRISSEALGLAVQELRDRLPCESPRDETEPMSLDAAMSFIRQHTPPA